MNQQDCDNVSNQLPNEGEIVTKQKDNSIKFSSGEKIKYKIYCRSLINYELYKKTVNLINGGTEIRVKLDLSNCEKEPCEFFTIILNIRDQTDLSELIKINRTEKLDRIKQVIRDTPPRIVNFIKNHLF